MAGRTRPGRRAAGTQRGGEDDDAAHGDGAHHPRFWCGLSRRAGSASRGTGAARRRGAGRRAGLPAAPHRPGQPARVLGGHRSPDRGGPARRGPRRGGARRRGRPAGALLQPRHAPAARHRPGHARAARPARPRRAHQRARPSADRRDAPDPAAVCRRRPHRRRLQPPAGRGGADLLACRRHARRAGGHRWAGRRSHRLLRHDRRPPRPGRDGGNHCGCC
ncbi:MAG: hypothetical protein BWY91_02584 [bacterium ADurb.BinA028]|nr:MAG: hypothetical protein BWY91_02584 [bacterium ADurb.BinA028]